MGEFHILRCVCTCQAFLGLQAFEASNEHGWSRYEPRVYKHPSCGSSILHSCEPENLEIANKFPQVPRHGFSAWVIHHAFIHQIFSRCITTNSCFRKWKTLSCGTGGRRERWSYIGSSVLQWAARRKQRRCMMDVQRMDQTTS